MPWLQKKKFDFYWTTTLTTLRSWWEKCSFFILLGRSLWKYLLTWSYIAHGITNLSKKFPNGILPGKSMCNLKNLLPQEFQWSLTWFTSLICFYKIRTCHRNFTVRNFSGVLHALLPDISSTMNVCDVMFVQHAIQ